MIIFFSGQFGRASDTGNASDQTGRLAVGGRGTWNENGIQSPRPTLHYSRKWEIDLRTRGERFKKQSWRAGNPAFAVGGDAFTESRLTPQNKQSARRRRGGRKSGTSRNPYRTPKSDSIDLARLLKVNGSKLGSLGRARWASSESSDGGSGCPRRSSELQPTQRESNRPIAASRHVWDTIRLTPTHTRNRWVRLPGLSRCPSAAQSHISSVRGRPSSRMIAILSFHS